MGQRRPKPKFRLVDGQLELHNFPYPHPSQLETRDTEEEWLPAVSKGLIKHLRFSETRALQEDYQVSVMLLDGQGHNVLNNLGRKNIIQAAKEEKYVRTGKRH